MYPRSVICHECGQIASVRGYGRIEYDWPETTDPGQEATTPIITSIRLTVDCPCCGVKTQEFFPEGSTPATPPSAPSVTSRDATVRRREVRFPKIGPANRRKFGIR